MRLTEYIKSDNLVNRENPKGRKVAKAYRIAHYISINKRNNILIRILGYPYLKMYRTFFYWIIGIEIPETVKIGKGLQIWHGYSLVINPQVVIGDGVLLRHNTTIGNKYDGSPCPKIGDNVNIGAHTVIIGDISIGNNVIIGAGSIVTKSIPDNSIAFGNPLKIQSIEAKFQDLKKYNSNA